MFCHDCGGNIPDGARCCPNCGKPVAENVTMGAVTPVKSKKKMGKKAKLALILIPVIIVLLVAGAVGVTAAVKLNTPMVKISKAFDRLVTSGDAYSYALEFNAEDESFNAGADLKIDAKAKTIEVRNLKLPEFLSEGFEYEFGVPLKDINTEAFVFVNDKKFGAKASAKADSDKYEAMVYNDVAALAINGEAMMGQVIYTEEQQKYVDMVFEILDMTFKAANGEMSEEEFIAAYKEKLAELNEEFLDLDIVEMLEYEPDEKVVKQVKKDARKKFTDKKWLSEYFGLSQSKKDGETLYEFDIEPEKALEGMYEILRPVIVDMADQIDGTDEDEVDEEFEDEIDYLKDNDIKYKLVIGVKDGVISKIKAEFSDEYEYEDENGAMHVSPDSYKFEIKIEKCEDFEAVNPDDYKTYYDTVKDGADEDGYFESEKAQEYFGYDDDYYYEDDEYYYEDDEYLEDDDIIFEDEETCADNISNIKSNVTIYYVSIGEMPTLEELAEMFEDMTIPCCPNSGAEYSITINDDGTATVYCTDPDCPNYSNY